MRPTRRYCPGRAPAYLVLQAVGFAVPASSPMPRCALTAPFHHYPAPIWFGAFEKLCASTIRRFAQAHRSSSPKQIGAGLCIFCGTVPSPPAFLRKQEGGRWPLAITAPCPARTFLPRCFAFAKQSDGGGCPTHSIQLIIIKLQRIIIPKTTVIFQRRFRCAF